MEETETSKRGSGSLGIRLSELVAKSSTEPKFLISSQSSFSLVWLHLWRRNFSLIIRAGHQLPFGEFLMRLPGAFSLGYRAYQSCDFRVRMGFCASCFSTGFLDSFKVVAFVFLPLFFNISWPVQQVKVTKGLRFQKHGDRLLMLAVCSGWCYQKPKGEENHF